MARVRQVTPDQHTGKRGLVISSIIVTPGNKTMFSVLNVEIDELKNIFCAEFKRLLRVHARIKFLY